MESPAPSFGAGLFCEVRDIIEKQGVMFKENDRVNIWKLVKKHRPSW